MEIKLAKGVFLLSLDLELAWGSVHGGNFNRRRKLFESTRPCITRLLKLLEVYKIQATWAVVGHLFLNECKPEGGIKHPEIIRPNYRWFTKDWYYSDPCSNLEEAPLWYGRDIIEQIISCPVKQEIGCHTFSHIRVGEKGCSDLCFTSELQACYVAAEKLGLNLKSFVFPRNSIGHLDALSKAGFSTYRGVTREWYNELPEVFSRIGRRLTNYLPLSPPVVLPRIDNGLVDLPATFFFPPTYRLKGLNFGVSRKTKAKMGLRQAEKKKKIFHMWFHPFNLASDPNKLFDDLEFILSEVRHYKEEGRLDNLSMGDLASFIKLNKV